MYKLALILELEWATLDYCPERLFKSCHGAIKCGGLRPRTQSWNLKVVSAFQTSDMPGCLDPPPLDTPHHSTSMGPGISIKNFHFCLLFFFLWVAEDGINNLWQCLLSYMDSRRMEYFFSSMLEFQNCCVTMTEILFFLRDANTFNIF